MTYKFAVIAALALAGGLAACQSTTVQPYFQENCTDRPFEAGFCDQKTNLRIFTPYGPMREDRAI